ncbi:hypothetical protein [Aggregatilinea lenta]|uniref:hypothetical protein n=1 Tax=Aggregatilinea lenta TaxID=913108 RepID=UPI000E5B08D2|nr:hypothetical protein [Aggregatilinea lenta]
MAACKCPRCRQIVTQAVADCHHPVCRINAAKLSPNDMDILREKHPELTVELLDQQRNAQWIDREGRHTGPYSRYSHPDLLEVVTCRVKQYVRDDRGRPTEIWRWPAEYDRARDMELAREVIASYKPPTLTELLERA